MRFLLQRRGGLGTMGRGGGRTWRLGNIGIGIVDTVVNKAVVLAQRNGVGRAIGAEMAVLVCQWPQREKLSAVDTEITHTCHWQQSHQLDKISTSTTVTNVRGCMDVWVASPVACD